MNFRNLINGVALYLNKFIYLSLKDALCQVWLKLVQWFLRRRFLKFVNVILPFRCNLPLNSLDSGILCAKFCWNWTSGSGEEELTMTTTLTNISVQLNLKLTFYLLNKKTKYKLKQIKYYKVWKLDIKLHISTNKTLMFH